MLKPYLYLASDHAGFELKKRLCEFLEQEGFGFDDLGAYEEKSCDYADYAHLLASKIDGQSFGILICGSGIGISIAANRHEGIRCALCSESLSARLARAHNNANVLALGARLIGEAQALEILRVFLQTPFEGGRHEYRIQKIEGS